MAPRARRRRSGGAQRIELITQAAVEVGPALFFSLLIVTLSFVPVFTLQAQEGRLFAPLAYTKTYAMAAAAGLSVTLVPVLMIAFIRGRIADESANPLNRLLIRLYRPVIAAVLARPVLTLVVRGVALCATLWPISRLGSEFMPPLDEGDLLYMPTALPGLAVGKASEILQRTDRILKTFPEVERVFGKMGRAESATDPAPLEMMETTLVLKPKSQWRAGLTTDGLIEQMDAALQIPGMANVWVQPIRNRIDMLATGIKSPVGIKIAGPDLAVIERVGRDIEAAVRTVAGHRVGVCRTGFGRPLHRDRAGPRAPRASRPVDRRRATHRQRGDRRRERRRDRRRPAAFSDQRALSARTARLGRGSARASDRDDARRNADARHDRERRDHGRSADDQKRKRAAERLDLRRHPRPRSRRIRGRCKARRGGSRGDSAPAIR